MSFVYTFTGDAQVESGEFVYYTMAVYQHTWGLTTFKKSAYQISVVSDATHVTVSSTRPETSELPLEQIPEPLTSSEAQFMQG